MKFVKRKKSLYNDAAPVYLTFDIYCNLNAFNTIKLMIQYAKMSVFLGKTHHFFLH